MNNFGQFPTVAEIQQGVKRAPVVMNDQDTDSLVPYAVWNEGILDSDFCDELIQHAHSHQSYEFPHCDATTRQLGGHELLDHIDTLTRNVNDLFFGFDLYKGHTAWHQYYSGGGSYQLHADVEPGISRKLTAIVMLTDGADYRGGDLEVLFQPVRRKMPRGRGTIVWIQGWLLHQVGIVHSGERESLNIGFYGPPFK